jgi:phosphoglycolate phosphatase
MKLAIFDLDGTIVDTIGGIAYSANLALVEYGYSEKTREFYIGAIGNGARALIERAVGDESVSEEKMTEILKRFLFLYEKNWDKELSVYEGTKKMFDELIDAGYSLAVNTNKPHDIAVKIIGYLFDNYDFVDIKGSQKAYPKKPHTAGVDLIFEKTGPVEICYYIGDSQVDFKTAQNANINFIGVDWGYGVEKIRNITPMISHPEELLEIVEQ